MIDTDPKFQYGAIDDVGVYGVMDSIGVCGRSLRNIVIPINCLSSQEKQIEVLTRCSSADLKQYFVLPGATKENLKVKRIEKKTYSFSYINPANKLEIYTELTFDDMLDSVEVKDGIAYFTFKKEDNIVKVK